MQDVTYTTPDKSLIGGCVSTRWGCCSDDITAKEDQEGTNCPGYRRPATEYQYYTYPAQKLEKPEQELVPPMQKLTPPKK